MEGLLTWATTQGAKLTKVGVSDANDRELVATENILAAETIISLPQSVLLHAGVVEDDPSDCGRAFGLLRDELGPEVDQRHLLCLLLILERCRGEESKWSSYIKILPKQYDDPYWWAPGEQQLVTGTRLSRAIEHYRPGLQQLSLWTTRLEQLRSSLDPSQSPGVLSAYCNGWAFTPEAARWARSTVWSRSFTVHRLCGSKRPVVALVPVLDMIDHSPEMEVVWHTGPDGQQDFQFCPLADFQKGAVLRNNYGSKTNDELILAYGFALPDNEADYFQVSIGRARGGEAAASSGAPTRVSATPGCRTASEAGPSSPRSGASADSSHPSGRKSSSPVTDAPRPRVLGGAFSVVPSRQAAPGSSSPTDGSDADSGAMQLHTEELLLEIAMLSIGLSPDHRLSKAEPLPEQLVRTVRLCLMPVPDLYRLNGLLMDGLLDVEDSAAALSVAAGGSGEGAVPGAQADQPPLASAGDSEMDVARSVPDATSLAPTASAATVSESLGPRGWTGPRAPSPPGGVRDCKRPYDFDSAMHIMPRAVQRRRQRQGPDDEPGDLSGAPSTPGAPVVNLLLLGSPAAAAEGSGGQGLRRTLADLPSLVSLRMQLEANLRALVSEQRASELLSQLGCSGVAPGPSRHAELALLYVRGQREILQAALAEIGSQIGAVLPELQRQALPSGSLVPTGLSGPSLPGSAFDVALIGSEGYSTSAVLVTGQQEHAACYSRWLADTMGPRGCSSIMEDMLPGLEATPPRPASALAEVACRPRREALFASASASGTKAAMNTSGSRGKRRPLASVTLRVIRKQAEGGSMAAAPVRPQLPEQLRPAAPAPAAAAAAVPSLPPGIAAALGLDLDLAHDPVSWGAIVTVDVRPGDVLVESCAWLPIVEQAPVECAVVAGSEEELVSALMVRAHAVLQELVALAAQFRSCADPDGFPVGAFHAAEAAPVTTSTATAATSAPSCASAQGPTKDVLVLHLMHMVGAAPAARLSASESDVASMLLEMLEDSPVGSSYQESLGASKSDFEQLCVTERAQDKAACAALGSGLEPGPRASRGGAGGGGRSPDPTQHTSHPPLLGICASTVAEAASRRAVNSGLRRASFRASPLSRVLAWPGALGLYCWACRVVERCAVRLRLPEASAADEPHAPLPRWAVLPFASAVPKQLREAVMQVELLPAVGESVGGDGGGGGAAAVSLGKGRLLVRACCALQAGQLLAPPLLLAHGHVDELLDSYGPESVAWRRLLARKQLQAPVGRPDCEQAASPLPASFPRASSVAAASAGVIAPLPADSSNDNVAAASSPAFADARYEMYISPSEQDPLYQEKLELLMSAGLGTVHYLTMGLETEALVLSALRICLADAQLLRHPLARQVVECRRALDSLRSGHFETTPPGAPDSREAHALVMDVDGMGRAFNAVGTALGVSEMTCLGYDRGVAGGAGLGVGSPVAASDSTPAAACSAGSEGAGPGTRGLPRSNAEIAPGGPAAVAGPATPTAAAGASLLPLVRSGQQALIDMLLSLPASHEVASAATKQLRMLVAEARKHTRRRIRQMDTLEQQKGGSGGFWGAGGAAPSAPPGGERRQPPGGGLGAELMRQGVHLYLEELAAVLDTWADHLGIETKLEPASKRPKLRHRASGSERGMGF